MTCKVRSVLFPLILLLPYALSTGYIPAAQPVPEEPAETVLTQPLEIEGSFSQEADGVTYTVSNVGIYPAVVEGAPSSYLLALKVSYSGADWNYLCQIQSGTVSFSADFSDPIEPSRTTYDDFTGDITYQFLCNEVPEAVYFQPGKYTLLVNEEITLTEIDTLEAETRYVEELGATRLVLSYEAGDLPYIPQVCTLLAAKDAPGETGEEPLSYSSISMNNAWDKNGNFAYGCWVFIIREAFEPAAYYDIQLHGYEKPLAQPDPIKIPIQK